MFTASGTCNSKSELSVQVRTKTCWLRGKPLASLEDVEAFLMLPKGIIGFDEDFEVFRRLAFEE